MTDATAGRSSLTATFRGLVRRLIPGVSLWKAQLLRAGKPVRERLADLEAAVAARWAAAAHRRLKAIQWEIPPPPEHFDHAIDLHYQWLATRNSFWLERGVFGGLALKGGRVLDLACGDGFNARNFYSLRSREVVACDFDPTAIATARRKNSAPNVAFVLADIRTDMPRGTFENVMWDAAIEHFTQAEMAAIFTAIRERLTPGGVLSGYTLVGRQDGQVGLEHHEYEFKSAAELESMLRSYFRNVRVFDTVYPDRHNLYFWASDGVLPLDR
jgi:SAM-dependent methyltransferase